MSRHHKGRILTRIEPAEEPWRRAWRLELLMEWSAALWCETAWERKYAS